MGNLENKYNIIIEDGDYVGKVENLKKYFIEELIYNLKVDLDNNSLEESIFHIDLIKDILEDLQEDWNDTDIVTIRYDEMGSYYIVK